MTSGCNLNRALYRPVDNDRSAQSLLLVMLEVVQLQLQPTALRGDQKTSTCTRSLQRLAMRLLKPHRCRNSSYPSIQQRLVATQPRISWLLHVLHRKHLHRCVSRNSRLSHLPISVKDSSAESCIRQRTFRNELHSHFLWERGMHPCHEGMQ